MPMMPKNGDNLSAKRVIGSIILVQREAWIGWVSNWLRTLSSMDWASRNGRYADHFCDKDALKVALVSRKIVFASWMLFIWVTLVYLNKRKESWSILEHTVALMWK